MSTTEKSTPLINFKEKARNMAGGLGIPSHKATSIENHVAGLKDNPGPDVLRNIISTYTTVPELCYAFFQLGEVVENKENGFAGDTGEDIEDAIEDDGP